MYAYVIYLEGSAVFVRADEYIQEDGEEEWMVFFMNKREVASFKRDKIVGYTCEEIVEAKG